MVGANGEVIFVADKGIVEEEAASVGVGTGIDGGERIESKVGTDYRTDGHLHVAGAGVAAGGDTEATGAGRGGGYDAGCICALVLAETFIVTKEKSAFFDNGTASGCAELVATEFGNLSRSVKLIARVERGV